MNIDRFKHLAGLSNPTSSKEVDPTVTKVIEKIKIREEVDFRLMAKKYGATVTIKEGTGRLVVKEDTLENSEKKMAELLAEWLSFKNGTPIQPVVETVAEDTKEETQEEVVEVVEEAKEETTDEDTKEETEESKEGCDAEDKKIEESGNNNFMQPVEDVKNQLNDRMGTNQERSAKVTVPAEVRKAVSARIAELKASMVDYDEKGYNDHSMKEKAIECLEQIMKDLSSGDREGLKQAQIFFSTLMSPITDLFPASLPVYLANAENITESWNQKLEEVSDYKYRRTLMRDAEGRRDMQAQLDDMGVEDEDEAHIAPSDAEEDDYNDWQSSAGSCYDYDMEPDGYYDHTEACPVCGEDNKISPAHLSLMQNPMCFECECKKGPQKALEENDFSAVLAEAPISNYDTVGDFSKRQSFHSKRDRFLIKNPRTIDIVKKKFNNSEHNFNFFFVNTKEAKDHLEVGKVDLSWVKDNLGQEVYEKVGSSDLDDNINVIFTNNRGDQGVPMTAWIMAHRLGHVSARNKHTRERGSAYHYASNQLIQTFADMMGAYTNRQLPKSDDEMSFSYRRNGTDTRRDQLMMKYFFQQVATFRSAREGIIRDWFEVLNELIAQYITTGKIKFKKAPASFQVNQAKFGKQRYYATPEALEEVNNTLESLGRDMQYYIDDILSSMYGNVYVM